MKDIEEISRRIEIKKRQFRELFSKDDGNYDLWRGKEQIFDTHKMFINITRTKLISLASKVLASMIRSRLQVTVLPPDKYPAPDAYAMANQEERMYYYIFDQANKKLRNMGETKLLPSLAWQATVLGRIAVRVLVYQDEEIVWDLLPLNPRFLTFSFGHNGLSWANYETFRSAENIEEEYGVEVDDREGKGVAVCDYWDRKHNVRFLSKDKKMLGKPWKNILGEVPIIIEAVNAGPKIMDETGIRVTNWGESIFDPVKVAFKKLNQMTSIAATHAHKLAANPEVYKYPEGQEPVLEEDAMRASGFIKIPNTHSLEGLRVPDIPNSLMVMIRTLETDIEQATFAELFPDQPPHSGSGLRILGQAKADFLNPRIDVLNDIYERICHMIKRQIILQGLTIPVKTVVDNTYQIYNMVPELLENDFYVHASFVRQDVYDEVEALQRAQMLMQLRLKSREDVMENVMQEQDPQTQMAKMDIEDVEANIPELKIKRAIKIYKERGMEEEAGMAEEQLALIEFQKRLQVEQMFTQGQQGGMPPGEAPPTQQGGMPAEEAPPMEV